jgi:DNA-binding transcriptional regulator YiaG
VVERDISNVDVEGSNPSPRSMTPTELRALLVTLGLSQAGAGRVLGVATRTVQQWAAGDRDIPETVRRILTLMVEESALVERMLAT